LICSHDCLCVTWLLRTCYMTYSYVELVLVTWLTPRLRSASCSWIERRFPTVYIRVQIYTCGHVHICTWVFICMSPQIKDNVFFVFQMYRNKLYDCVCVYAHVVRSVCVCKFSNCIHTYVHIHMTVYMCPCILSLEGKMFCSLNWAQSYIYTYVYII